MQQDEFVGLVQHRAGLSSEDDAERACRATLETLGERLAAGLADRLAARLPGEIGEHLRRTEAYGGAISDEGAGHPEFVARIASRASVSESEAVRVSRAVLEVVDEVTEGVATPELRDGLPPDIRKLVPVGRSK